MYFYAIVLSMNSIEFTHFSLCAQVLPHALRFPQQSENIQIENEVN